jgi:hypothetical protein
MATKSQMQDIFDKYRYDPSIVKKSKTWFEQQALLLSKKRITPQMVINNDPANVKSPNSIMPGKMYMFFYDPKLKAELPYYDKFPLVFPFRRMEDGFIGLNMHYLPHRLRIMLMDRLMIFANNDKMDATTKLRYSWALIDGVAKFNLAKPCVKRYLTNHLKSQLVNVPADDWTTAMMLPVERFTKASKEYVWSESRKKI